MGVSRFGGPAALFCRERLASVDYAGVDDTEQPSPCRHWLSAGVARLLAGTHARRGDSTDVLVVGDRLSGKTSLIYRLKLDTLVEPSVTVGTLSETVVLPVPWAAAKHQMKLTELGVDPRDFEVKLHSKSAKAEDQSISLRCRCCNRFLTSVTSVLVNTFGATWISSARQSLLLDAYYGRSVYLTRARLVVYVVNSPRHKFIADTILDLAYLLRTHVKAKFSIFLNKQDVRTAIRPVEFRKRLSEQLQSVEHARYQIFGTSALTGEGLHEGLEWLLRPRVFANPLTLRIDRP